MSININLNTNIIADESIELNKIKGYEQIVQSDDLEHTHDVDVEEISEIDSSFTGTEGETDKSSETQSINSITKTNELPSLNLSCEGGSLSISFSQGTQVEFEEMNVASSEHTHTYTPSGQVSNTFKKVKKTLETSGRKNSSI